MKTKQHLFSMLLIFFSFVPKALATDYYTTSASATLAGNTGAVNANWTTNPDGTTGLTTVAITTTDNLIILNGAIATITAGMSIGTLTINTGGRIIHNNNASASTFTINGLLTWNGTIKTLNATSGSNYFNANGDVTGTTALHDAASTRGIYMGGDGLRTINLTQVAGGIINSTSVGLLITKNHLLTGNCKWYSPLIYNQDCSLDLAGYSLQVSSIKGGTTARLIKGNSTSDLTISGGVNPSIIYFDPASSILNNFKVNNDFSTGTTTVAVNATAFTINNFSKSSGGNTIFSGELTVNTSLNFGVSTGTTYTGTLQVNGNFSLGNNGIVNVQTKGTTVSTQYDQLSVTGNINIGTSTTIKINTLNSYIPPAGSLFDFAKSTTGTISGSFQIIQSPNSFITTVSYPSANTVQCELTKICSFSLTPDLPLVSSNPTVEAEIETIVQRFSDTYLGTTEPTTTALDAAIASYNALGISVNGNTITASVAITNYNQTTFLKTFAQYLKFHPEDSNNIFTKALNTVWIVSDRVCKGTLPLDYNQYNYRDFAKAAILIPNIKNNLLVKSLFENVLYKQNNFDYIWEPNVNVTSVGHNLDHIGNSGVVTMAYAKWIDSADERFRYMTAFKRQMETFNTYSVGTEDGLKPDGSGFHHWASYPSYMYNLNAEADIVYMLRQTSFEINSESYLRLRDAIMAQLMMTNDNTTRFLTLTGRKPEEIATTISRYQFRNMAVAGGSILGTGFSDPVMATLYNRLWGSYAPFGNSTIAPFNEGYFQFNHSMAGIYRKNNWVVTYKGFNNNMFGTEIYGPSEGSANRFGRYQSYGAVNVVCPGDALTGNGYDVTTWNWNYNPGTTVIQLPWNKLEAETEFIDELQSKRFAGSLSFINKNSDYLKAIHGTYGMFAMDFQEARTKYWGATYSSNNHNTSFVFKKSVFTFDNMLICLGSNIGNNDAVNNTLTTLYQRKAIAGSGKETVTIDNNSLPTTDYSNSYSSTNNHWIVDNFSTGFYVISGSGTIKLTKANQQTPQHNKRLSEQTITNNPVGNYTIGYLDHGLAPSNQGYEYICMPQATAADMTNLDSQIGAGNKPYTVHRKDNLAHIVEYKPTNGNPIFGYAFFSALSAINNTGQLTGASYPCLVMSQYDSIQKSLKVAVNNPDLGFTWRTATPSADKLITITIKGTNWQISQPNARASITGTANGETTIQFTVIDGLPVEIVLNRVLTPQTINFDAIPTKTITDPAFDLTATASSGLAVSYTSSNPAVATISGNTVTIVGAGTSTITASQEGDDIYAAATPVEQTLTVNTIIAPVADAYVRDGSYASANYGTATTLTIKKDGTSYSREAYLKFDLNGVNSFDNATLRLNIASANTNVASTTWQVYYVPTDSWLETDINWNNKPASDVLLATINGQSSGWAEWNITDQVLTELSGDKTLSLRIVSTVINSASDASFRSKEDINASLRPQLVLAPGSLSGRISGKNNLISKSIEPDIKNNTVQAYPNPTKDVLYINLGEHRGSEAKVFDIHGHMLLNQKLTINNTPLNLSELPTGLYLVKIFAASEEIAVMKIVKE